MINLEELRLYLSVGRFDSPYISGIELYDHFLIYMTQLNKFTFNIQSNVDCENVTIELPSNEDIQRSFIGRGYQNVASYVYTDSFSDEGECRIYSLPYDFEYFVDLDNSFQGGMFHKVRLLKMSEAMPFEHKLFELISQGFSFLEFLYICNREPQKDKQHYSHFLISHFLIYDVHMLTMLNYFC